MTDKETFGPKMVHVITCQINGIPHFLIGMGEPVDRPEGGSSTVMFWNKDIKHAAQLEKFPPKDVLDLLKHPDNSKIQVVLMDPWDV